MAGLYHVFVCCKRPIVIMYLSFLPLMKILKSLIWGHLHVVGKENVQY